MTPGQSKAARDLLGWSQAELATKSGVSQKTIADFERGARVPRPLMLSAIQQGLEDGGVKFIADDEHGGVGVRLAKLKRRGKGE